MNKKVGIIVLIIVLILLLIVISVAINKNNESKINKEREIIKEILGEDSGDIIENIVIKDDPEEKMNNLKEAMLKSDLLNGYVEVSEDDILKTYNFEPSDDIFYFALKKNNENEVCVVELHEESNEDNVLMKLIERYDELLGQYESTEDVSIKQRGKIQFLIVSNNKDEIENIIEKEYLDK